jgi:hypothetical protein
MKSCFPEDNLHSRVIITTRNNALALHCSLGASDHIYKIAASLVMKTPGNCSRMRSSVIRMTVLTLWRIFPTRS